MKAGAIRRFIAHVDGAWVRTWRDGEVWAGSSRKTGRAAADVRAALEAAGFGCAMLGRPGTAGEHVVNIVSMPVANAVRRPRSGAPHG